MSLNYYYYYFLKLYCLFTYYGKVTAIKYYFSAAATVTKSQPSARRKAPMSKSIPTELFLDEKFSMQ